MCFPKNVVLLFSSLGMVVGIAFFQMILEMSHKNNLLENYPSTGLEK